MKQFKKCIIVLFIFICSNTIIYSAWDKGHFTIKKYNGREILFSPDDKPFYSRAMCYAWGPETGKYKGEPNTPKKIINDLKIMQEHGFNTLNLYGLHHLEEVLTWCDENEFGFYPRMNYYDLPAFPATLSEFPDFMNPEFRKMAKKYFDKYCAILKKHPSVIAIDMDQRWLFPLDWSGKKHIDTPMLGKASIEYFTKWLKNKYKKIEKLNKLWKKDYDTFEDILKDVEIVQNNKMLSLKRNPWRVDVYEYALWTIDDFLLDLTGYIRKIDIPERMVTITSEMPEVCPFPLSTKESSGLSFISPVHYNAESDFNRDWISLGELLYMTKWHNDLQKMPVYISETGFRSEPLKQNPPFMAYAAGKHGDKDFIAEMYLRQTALTNIWAWMLGWTHFKFYDKLFEGDFGYINDDRTNKPIAELGQYINDNLPVNHDGDPAPEVWIYYPEYALSSYYASYQQYKSLVIYLQNDFIIEFEKMISDVQSLIKSPSKDILKEDIVKNLLKVYKEKWVPFKFTDTVPDDDKPIIIAGRSLELLSMEDREKLNKKKLIVMERAGITDERYNTTDKWFLKDVISEMDIKPVFTFVDLSKLYNNDGIGAKADKTGNFFNNEVLDAATLPVSGEIVTLNNTGFQIPDYESAENNNIVCKGQEISVVSKGYTKIHFIIASHDGDIAETVKLIYSNGMTETRYLSKTITDWKSEPYYYDYAVACKNLQGDKRYLSHITIPSNVTYQLEKIILPAREKIHIFAITLEISKETFENIENTVKLGDITSTGKLYWMIPLNNDDITGKILAKFRNDKPAIVKSKDGNKIVYLYDALTWTGGTEEISYDRNSQAKILHYCIDKLK